MPEKPYIGKCIKCGVQFLSTKYEDDTCPFHRGKLKGDYPRVFYKNRKLVMERDEDKCQCCGCERDGQFTNRLTVHHIDTDKGNNSPSNLITLCQQCHLSLHGKYSNWLLRRSNIYKLFANDSKFGEFGKNLIYGAAKQLVKKQFTGKPKLFFGIKKL